MKKGIEKWNNVVISGSLVDWGDCLIPLLTLAIRIETDTNVRIKRLEKREKEHFGSRIDVGGDMYKNNCDFIECAASYDNGDLNMRSKIKHDDWQKNLKCKQIKVNGNNSLEDNFKIVLNYL